MKRLCVLLVGALALGCVDSTDTDSAQRQALESYGFTQISIQDAVLFGCGEGDSVLTSVHFTATNPNGRRVSGTVCCGLLIKNCTVRF